MQTATKNELMMLRGPEPLSETLAIPGTDLAVSIRGLVRSAGRSAVYREIEEMTGIRDVAVDGERIDVTDDDIVAACWASVCVTSPNLTAFEWLMVGARNTDLLGLIGERCLICSRLIASESTPDGASAAEAQLLDGRDPFVYSPSGSVSNGSAACQASSNVNTEEPESAATRLIII